MRLSSHKSLFFDLHFDAKEKLSKLKLQSKCHVYQAQLSITNKAEEKTDPGDENGPLESRYTNRGCAEANQVCCRHTARPTKRFKQRTLLLRHGAEDVRVALLGDGEARDAEELTASSAKVDVV